MTLPYIKDSATSAEAAERAEPRAETQRALVFRTIMVGRPGLVGMTDDEIHAALDMNPSTLRPRRIELQNRGLVEDSGEKRRTRSGRWATVWRAVPAKEEA